MHKAILICISVVMFFAQPILAETAKKGPVTNLPMPRYVSLKAGEANARRGPSLSHKIDWVYKRRGVPLEIYAEYENWRRVRDYEGAGGWIHYSLLSGVRTVLITQDSTNVFRKHDENATVVARFEKTLLRIWAPAPRRGAKLKLGDTKDGRKNPPFGASIPVRHVNSPLPAARLLIICDKQK
jgi:SH3-like domain-containing protein